MTACGKKDTDSPLVCQLEQGHAGEHAFGQTPEGVAEWERIQAAQKAGAEVGTVRVHTCPTCGLEFNATDDTPPPMCDGLDAAHEPCQMERVG
jgi:hypothetical protein